MDLKPQPESRDQQGSRAQTRFPTRYRVKLQSVNARRGVWAFPAAF